jgi:hypothetical protein
VRHYETMGRSELRKSRKIFIKMSKALRTRVPEQCRSHHQKMIELHSSLPELIRFYREEVFPLGNDHPTHKAAKTAKTTHDSQERLYRVERSGNCFRLEINADLVASY